MAVSIAVRPPPMTTTGQAYLQIGEAVGLGRAGELQRHEKSEACRTPAASPFFIGTIVGLPAPAQSAM